MTRLTMDPHVAGSYRAEATAKPLRDLHIFVVIDRDRAQAQIRKSTMLSFHSKSKRSTSNSRFRRPDQLKPPPKCWSQA